MILSMTRTIYVLRGGALIDKREAPPLHRAAAAPMIRADGMAPVRSMADVFRLAVLWAEGGVYADADMLCLAPLYMLIKKQARPGLIVVYRNRIQNGFIVQREPRDPFIGACLELAISNIEVLRFPDVYTATGPAIYNALWALIAPEDSAGAPEDPYARAWDAPEMLVHARERIEATPELVASFRSMTLLHQVAVDNWIVDGVPAYRQTPLHWCRWKGSIYEDA